MGKHFHLNFLTDTVEKLNKHPTSLFVVYNEVFVPFNKAGKDIQFLRKIHEMAKHDGEWEGIDLNFDLSIDDRSFLFTVLIEHFTDIPKWVYIDKMIVYICKAKS